METAIFDRLSPVSNLATTLAPLMRRDSAMRKANQTNATTISVVTYQPIDRNLPQDSWEDFTATTLPGSKRLIRPQKMRGIKWLSDAEPGDCVPG